MAGMVPIAAAAAYEKDKASLLHGAYTAGLTEHLSRMRKSSWAPAGVKLFGAQFNGYHSYAEWPPNCRRCCVAWSIAS